MAIMYVPRAFAEERPEVIAEAIRAARIGELVTMTSGGLEATPLPLLLEPGGEHGTLFGHLTRGNPQWRSADGNIDALVIFRPADAYISPSLYATKQQDGRVVPTWNYVTVHVWGPLIVHDDRDWLDQHVRRLTDRHERDRKHAWSVDDAPPEYVKSLLGGIVGIEIPIARVQAKWKLNQNHPTENIDGVIRGLEAEDGTKGGRLIASLMRNLL
jgi:transcriptional regulator